MLIDWFTVSAQIVNFLILVWLMKRFLYQPILRAIDAREKKIAAELADADQQKSAAAEERAQFQKKNETFDQQRDDLLKKATGEVAVERQRLLNDATKAADAERAKRRQGLEREEQNLSEDITHRTREEVFAIARKTLADLADDSLESRMSEVFARRVRQLSGEAKERLAAAIKTSTEPVVVHSAFDLPAAQRAALQQALNETFAAAVPLRFDTAPAVISGIELTVNGQKLSWSIADYLGSLETTVRQLLKPQPQSEVKSNAATNAAADSAANAEANFQPHTQPAAPAAPAAPAHEEVQ